MALIGRIRRRLERMRNAAVHRKSLKLRHKTAVVSFTFDDFPRSAYTVAGRILKYSETQGTYYAAFGLMGQAYIGGDLFLEEDLRGLLHDRHELGCHTYSHVDCRELSRRGLLEEISRNGSVFAQYLADSDQQSSIVNFAYPFGSVTPATKQVVKRHFASARGSLPGVNSGVIDLACLRANTLYSNTVPIRDIQKLIEQNEKKQGWLIFYTHDVSDTPSPYGCTPAYFESVVKAATLSSSRVLNIRSALGALGADLTPESWSRQNVRLGPLERRSGCQGRSTPPNRSSAS